MSEVEDIRYMARALRLAARGLYSTNPNPRVGCVLVQGGRVVGEGWHEHAGAAHAEINALAQAGPAANGATAYVTLEPCSHFGRTPPCADALIGARVVRVVVAMADPNPQVSGQGIARLREAGIETSVGLLEAEAEQLNPGFLRRMRGGLPWVRLKIAASMDGRTAMRSGESKWITGVPARADVQRLRARSSAIITGIGTVLADDPAMTVRVPEMGPLGLMTVPVKTPCRIVLDSQLRLPPDARILQEEGDVVVLCQEPVLERSVNAEPLRRAGAELVGLPAMAATPSLSWSDVLAWLKTRAFNEVLIEAGATLAGSALAAGCIDELWLYQAPTLLGSKGQPMATLPLDRMSQQIRLRVFDQRKVGEDLRTLFRLQGDI